MNEEVLISRISDCMADAPGAVDAFEQIIKDEANFNLICNSLVKLDRPEFKLYLIESLNRVFSPKSSNDSIFSRPRFGSFDESSLSNYASNIMKFLVTYVKQYGSSLPNFIINSACNAFGNQLKNQIVMQRKIEEHIQLLEASFISPNSQMLDAKYLLKFIYYILTNLTTNPSLYGYFEYRKLIISFEEWALPFCLNVSQNVIKQLADFSQPTFPDNHLETLLLSLEVFYKLLCFPFGLSYYEYTLDLGSDDITLILFPDVYCGVMEDRALIQTFLNLITRKISKEVSIEVLRILGKMVSCRLSLFTDDEERLYHKQTFVRMFYTLVDHTPLNDRTFLNEVIEFGLRAIFVFSIRFINNVGDAIENWELAWSKVGMAAVQGSNSIIDPVLSKYLEYIKKWSDFESTKAKPLQLNFISNYVNHFFNIGGGLGFFPDTFLAPKKFVKSAEKRFGVMRDFYNTNSLDIDKILEVALSLLAGQEAGIQKGEDPNLFACRLAHFILMTSSLMLKVDYKSSIDFYSDGETNEGSSRGKVCSFLFGALTRLHSFERFLKPEIRRSLEMSILFFFELFVGYLKQNSVNGSDPSGLSINSEAWTQVLSIGIFDSYNKFFGILSDKILSNFRLNDHLLSRYSVQVMRAVVEKTKKMVEVSKQAEMLHGLAEKLFGVIDQLLSSPKHMKIRSELIQLLAVIYLDDVSEDYIENAKMLMSKLDLLSLRENGVVLLHFLNDSLGLITTINNRKIFATCIRIFYPKIRSLLQSQGSNIMADSSLVCIILDFYSALVGQLAQIDFGTTQEISLHVMADCCGIVGLLVKEMNAAVIKIQPSSRVDFLSQHNKLIKRLLRIFCKLLKNAGVSFTVFQSFGDHVFVEFVKQVLHFISMVGKPIFENFPQIKEDLVTFLTEISTTITQMIVDTLSPEDLMRYFETLFLYFSTSVETVIYNPESKNLGDDSLISNVQSIVAAIATEIYEVEKIYAESDDKVIKVRNTVSETAQLVCEFIVKLIDYSFNLNLSNHNMNLLADIVFYFLIAYYRHNVVSTIELSLTRLYPHISSDDIIKCIDEFRGNLQVSLKPQNRENFQLNFQRFLKHFRQLMGQKGR